MVKPGEHEYMVWHNKSKTTAQFQEWDLNQTATKDTLLNLH